MTFDEAETQFRELAARLKKGKSLGRTSFEELVGQLTVIENGLWWEIHPHTGHWNYFDGTRWVESIPPGHTTSVVMEMNQPPSTYHSTMSRVPDPPEHVSPTPRMSSAMADTSDRLPRRPRWARQTPSPGAKDRLWIIFTIAAIVLFVCAIGLLLSSRVLTSITTPSATPIAVVQPVPSPTLVPSPIPSPTLPIPTETPTPILGKITERRVNVRAAPSTDAKIIGKTTQDTEITLIGRNQDGTWYQVRIVDIAEPSWIFSETMQITNGDPNRLPIVQ